MCPTIIENIYWKSNFFRRCSFCVFSVAFFCGCGGKQHFIWKLGIVRTSSGVKKWTYRFVTLDSAVHTIFFSRYRSGSSRGQKNNECGLLSNVPRLCLWLQPDSSVLAVNTFAFMHSIIADKNCFYLCSYDALSLSLKEFFQPNS